MALAEKNFQNFFEKGGNGRFPEMLFLEQDHLMRLKEHGTFWATAGYLTTPENPICKGFENVHSYQLLTEEDLKWLIFKTLKYYLELFERMNHFFCPLRSH